MTTPPSGPADAGPFIRVQDYLTGRAPMDSVRVPAQVIMSPDFERVALSPGWSAAVRLTANAEIANLVPNSPLPARERNIIITELSRLALRILWWQGLLGPGMATEAKPDVAAATLIEFAAAGLLPEGPAGWMVLDRAKNLLARTDVIMAFQSSEGRRTKLIKQLVAAEENVRRFERAGRDPLPERIEI